MAVSGLIIRLLTLPNNISGTVETLKYIKSEIGPQAYLSIMSQYYPTYKSRDFKDLSCRVTVKEYENVIDEARHLGLNEGWIQDGPDATDPGLLGTNIKLKKTR